MERTWRETCLCELAPISTKLILRFIAERALGLPRSSGCNPMHPPATMDRPVEVAAPDRAEIADSARATARFPLFDWPAVARADAGEPRGCIVSDAVLRNKARGSLGDVAGVLGAAA